MKTIIRNVVACLLLCSLCACQEPGEIKEKTNGNTVNTEKTEKTEKTAGIVKETLESYLKNKQCQIIYPVKDTVIACKRVLKDRTLLDFMDLDTGKILATLGKEFFCNTLSVEMCGDVCVIQEVKEMGETEDVPVLLLNVFSIPVLYHEVISVSLLLAILVCGSVCVMFENRKRIFER